MADSDDWELALEVNEFGICGLRTDIERTYFLRFSEIAIDIKFMTRKIQKKSLRSRWVRRHRGL